MVTIAMSFIHDIIGIFIPVMAVTFVVRWSWEKLYDIVEVVPSALLSGLVLVLPFFLIAYFTGPELIPVLGVLIIMAVYALLLRILCAKSGPCRSD